MCRMFQALIRAMECSKKEKWKFCFLEKLDVKYD